MRTAQLAGLSTSTVWKVLYGDPTRGQAPCKRVRPETAAALLAVRADLDTLADRAHVDAAGTRRRLQALIAIGWSQSKLAERLGMRRSNLTKTMRGTRVTAANARAVRDLYDRLWDADPAAHGVTAQAIVRSRNTARANGWPPPAAWDDDLIDLPEPELHAELERRAAAMDDAEVRRCYRAARDGERSPLVRAGAREYYRRRRRHPGGEARMTRPDPASVPAASSRTPTPITQRPREVA